jgi:hypothetical protein
MRGSGVLILWLAPGRDAKWARCHPNTIANANAERFGDDRKEATRRFFPATHSMIRKNRVANEVNGGEDLFVSIS